VSELTAALRAIFEGDGRERIVETARKVSSLKRDSFPSLDRQAVEQMARGYLAMILEHLDGEKREVRDYWVETLAPGLMEHGRTLEQITRGGVIFSVIFAYSVVSSLPPELRIEGAAWAAAFHGGLQADMTRECLAKMARDSSSTAPNTP